MWRFIFIFSIFLILSFEVIAQGTATGCLYNDQVYNNLGSKGIYNNSSVYLSSNYCSWTPNSTGTTCTICPGGLNPGGNCPGGPGATVTGYEGTFTMIECSIDGYYCFILFITLTFLATSRNVKLLSI